jgi:manganese oxidase
LDDIRDNFEAHANEPHELVRPLVLRARRGEKVTVRLTNHIEDRYVGMHLIADGYDVTESDGAKVGNNNSTLAEPNNFVEYEWDCQHEGVFPFHDAGNLSGGEDGTNVHGLFGALVVEPPHPEWTDPEKGSPLEDGLYADVHPEGKQAAEQRPNKPAPLDEPDPYPPLEASFREYVVFFHDEPEFVPPHGPLEPNPCPEEMGGHGGGGHGGCCCDHGCQCSHCSICGACHESGRGRCHSDSGREC